MTVRDRERSGKRQLDLSLLRRRDCETLSGRGRMEERGAGERAGGCGWVRARRRECSVVGAGGGAA